MYVHIYMCICILGCGVCPSLTAAFAHLGDELVDVCTTTSTHSAVKVSAEDIRNVVSIANTLEHNLLRNH